MARVMAACAAFVPRRASSITKSWMLPSRVATTGTPAALSSSAADAETLCELLRRVAENTAGYATRATVVD